jgi:glycosyltransferase involved in cell wall biosynthesis
MVPTLAVCDRLLVHSIEDLNRLKTLGLTHNVALFPHGALLQDTVKPVRKSDVPPLIATYGFALPHKGLGEIIEAMKILKERNFPVRLRLVNSEHPADVSKNLLDELRYATKRYGLDDQVEFHSEFLSDDESLRLLEAADLMVFAYQDTGESASGAVRYGMALGNPVIVTPIPIFNDLGDAVFKFSGVSAHALADGIERTLKSILGRNDEYKKVMGRAEDWRRSYDYVAVGRRLKNICKSLI